MKYTIIENQHRADGEINTVIEHRQTLASAQSYYYERKSKMVMTELYPSVHIILLDSNLVPLEHADIDTQYPVPEVEVYEPSAE